jgi:hypothetical protein
VGPQNGQKPRCKIWVRGSKMGKSPKVKLEFGTVTMGTSPRNKIRFWAPEHQKARKMGKSPRSKIWARGSKMGKSPKVKLEFGTLTMGKSPRKKFYFVPRKPQKAPVCPQNGLKPRSKIWVWKSPQKDKFPQSKIWVWAHKNCGLWVGWWAQKWAKAPEKFDFGGRQQCVVKARYHFKGQCS